MGGVVKSVGAVFGIGPGAQQPQVPVASGNAGLEQMNWQNQAINSANSPLFDYNKRYLAGEKPEDFIKWGTADQSQALWDALATGAQTGTKFATNEVQNNPILGQLFGQGGQLSKSIAEADRLQNQGFQLTPEDREAYGQASGDIARLFGQQEQSAAQSLADRGLASAPSGAAGALFSGLAGNKNEMLAKSQMQIANMRMQNTMQRLQQQQSMINSLGAQAQGAIQSQYGRQLQGQAARQGNMTAAAQLQQGANEGFNKSQMAAANYEAQNKPMNIGDAWGAGFMNRMYDPTGGSTFSPRGGQIQSNKGGGGGGGSAAGAVEA